MEQQGINQIIAQVLAVLARTLPVGISNRHIHLSAEHVDILFGQGHTLTKQKELKQVGEFAAVETVVLVGPRGVMQGVRVLGPKRKLTQVEISQTDGFVLGINPPVRDSGQIVGSVGITIVGPCGSITLKEGVICVARHIHMSCEDALHFGVSDGDRVEIEVDGARGGSFRNVLVRVSPNFRLEFHADTDEANAMGLNNGDLVTLRNGIRLVHKENVTQESLRPLKDREQESSVALTKAKVLITAELIKEAALGGVKSYNVARGTLLTPLARDIAKECGLKIIES